MSQLTPAQRRALTLIAERDAVILQPRGRDGFVKVGGNAVTGSGITIATIKALELRGYIRGIGMTLGFGSFQYIITPRGRRALELL